MEKSGIGHERDYSTKQYEFGDPFNLHIERTVRNAIKRTGGGTPVRLTPEDFEVERTETVVRSSTVLMLDLSLSMPMRDNFLPAKKVAMALHALISMQYPRDFLGIVGFSEVAREIKAHELPEVSWDFVYGTNMQHGFMLSRKMLAKQSGTKQIIMITDGEPTAHIDRAGRPFFSYPPVKETVDKTLAEVAGCTQGGDTDQHLHARRVVVSHPFHRAAHQDEWWARVLHHTRDARRLCVGGLRRAQAQALERLTRRESPIPACNRAKCTTESHCCNFNLVATLSRGAPRVPTAHGEERSRHL